MRSSIMCKRNDHILKYLLLNVIMFNFIISSFSKTGNKFNSILSSFTDAFICGYRTRSLLNIARALDFTGALSTKFLAIPSMASNLVDKWAYESKNSKKHYKQKGEQILNLIKEMHR